MYICLSLTVIYLPIRVILNDNFRLVILPWNYNAKTVKSGLKKFKQALWINPKLLSFQEVSKLELNFFKKMSDTFRSFQRWYSRCIQCITPPPPPAGSSKSPAGSVVVAPNRTVPSDLFDFQGTNLVKMPIVPPQNEYVFIIISKRNLLLFRLMKRMKKEDSWSLDYYSLLNLII